ncbi:uncharacterized protein YALI1_D12940g [Yarrowia lipolytica]|uniref:Uncharacterized protein n=1 Tax=Yarrowia lipolytica TaxID=4952 RepID=A0A1D8NDZ6_YARLL|nr:hypothetical protein YALI1_D12940g [Yarrowia lipolytica]
MNDSRPSVQVGGVALVPCCCPPHQYVLVFKVYIVDLLVDVASPTDTAIQVTKRRKKNIMSVFLPNFNQVEVLIDHLGSSYLHCLCSVTFSFARSFSHPNPATLTCKYHSQPSLLSHVRVSESGKNSPNFSKLNLLGEPWSVLEIGASFLHSFKR